MRRMEHVSKACKMRWFFMQSWAIKPSFSPIGCMDLLSLAARFHASNQPCQENSQLMLTLLSGVHFSGHGRLACQVLAPGK